jgi:hypothetical protein
MQATARGLQGITTLQLIIDTHPRRSSDAGSSADAGLGAVRPIQRFGSSLNRLDERTMLGLRLRALTGTQTRSQRIGHCCVNDGMFEPAQVPAVCRKPRACVTRL